MLRQQLAPKHAYIEVVQKIAGPQAVIKGTRVPVSVIVGYLGIRAALRPFAKLLMIAECAYRLTGLYNTTAG